MLNLQQAIQGCIDLGSHIVSDEGWGVPVSISEIFYKFEEHDIISPELAENLIPMAGFQNLVVHQYEDIDYKIVFVIYHERFVDIENSIDAVQVHFPV